MQAQAQVQQVLMASQLTLPPPQHLQVRQLHLPRQRPLVRLQHRKS